MKTQNFFSGAPLAIVLPALERVSNTTEELRAKTRQSLKEFEIVIGQGNRPDRIHTHLHEANIIPKFNYYFSGSKTGSERMAEKWFEREVLDNSGVHTPYIWDSPIMWKNFFDLLDNNRDKQILISSSAPRDEHKRLVEYPNVLFASPTPEIAVLFGDDKRYMADLYQSLGMKYDVCNYCSAEDVNKDYLFHREHFNSENIVVQATIGSGGVTTTSSIQALFFVNSEQEFQNALNRLKGEGPVRVMKRFDGIPSNTSALSLPFGTFVSGIPSIKPCGLKELGAKDGTSGGNQWDNSFFHETSIDSQYYQLEKVGTKMAATGYHGVFGLDPIMPKKSEDLVFNSEINARSQGPDPQRAYAALKAGIPSLEEIQLAFYLKCPKEIFPNVADYNLVTRWLKIPPYLKLFPKQDLIVRKNFNGHYNWQGKLVKTSPLNASFKIIGAPYIGQKIVTSSPDNFLYVKFLDENAKIFTHEEKPKLTAFAREIVNYIYQNI
ncbi:MAG: hypothetical protein NTZ44_00050 [Candidatus Nomurabacteria bacterium]|nr:hypothetical protein [Candidatus Nomurabacteria bacterium]